MPAAIPLVVGAAATAGAGALGLFGATAAFGVGSLFGTFAGAAIGGVASFAAGQLVSASTRSDPAAALSQPGGGRTQQFRQPTAPQQIIFGRVKVSGPVLFVHTSEDDDGRTFGDFYLVVGLSGAHVKAIDTVYLGDELATLDKFQSAGALARITKYLGSTTQTADPDYVSEIPDKWTTNHRLRGRAYLACRFTYDSEAYRDGVPNVSAIADGNDEIYDPRSEATGFTNNAALIVAKWLTASFGLGLAWAELDEDSVIAAANICDERVSVVHETATFTATEIGGSPTGYTSALTLAAGARVLDWGDGVRVLSSGTLPSGLSADTTYYVIPSADETIKLATTVSNAFAGVAVTLASAGNGTHTLTYWDEARYKIGGAYTLDTAKGDILGQLLDCMAGVVTFIGGKWFVHAGAAAAPTVTVTADDLRGDITWVPKRSMRDRFNGVRATFVNPDANWQPTDAPPLQDDGYLTADGGEELWEDRRYPLVRSARQAQRLNKVALEINRHEDTITLPLKLTGMRLQPWDGFYLTIQRPDGSYVFEEEQYRVMGWALSEDGGIDITARRDSASIYDWRTSDDEQALAATPTLSLPDPAAIAAPATLTVTPPTTPTFTSLAATWAAVSNIYRAGYDFEYRGDGDTDWNSAGRIDDDAQDNDVNDAAVLTSVATDMQVRAVSTNGTPSAFIQALAPDMPSLASPAVSGTTISFTKGGGAATTQVFEGTSTDFAESALVDTTSGTTYVGTSGRNYWLRSVSAQGSISTETSMVVVL